MCSEIYNNKKESQDGDEEMFVAAYFINCLILMCHPHDLIRAMFPEEIPSPSRRAEQKKSLYMYKS